MRSSISVLSVRDLMLSGGQVKCSAACLLPRPCFDPHTTVGAVGPIQYLEIDGDVGMIEMRDLDSSFRAVDWVDELAPLVCEAGRPYVDWLLGSPEAALEATTKMMYRPSSEYYAGRVSVLAASGKVKVVGSAIGFFIALPGAEIGRCRRSDSMVMAGAAPDRRVLLERLASATDLFDQVPEDCYYLSRIGVKPERRGQGLGAYLVSQFIARGVDRGFSKFRLNVSADNECAIGLYRSHGFLERSRADIPNENVTYVAMEFNAH